MACREPVIRAGVVIVAAGLVVCLIVPNSVGLNLTRMVWLLAAPLIVAYGHRPDRHVVALTALALIFAVFLTNPAPICVLDEVDAPLDDHNVERFCDLLDEMIKSTDTRFVIITHNPITMARMNRLYGVTMAERGVSQLVSVDLEAAVRFREAS